MTPDATTITDDQPAGETPVLRTENLTKNFGGLTAVDGADITIQPGELRCIIGPNGAGKSTFLKLITGQHRPTNGTIWYNGDDITDLAPHRRVQLGMSMKSQVPGIYGDLTVRENVRLALQRSAEKRELAGKITDVLEEFNLADEAHLIADNLAHGKKQWLEIGMATALDPDLLLLDEPTAGMAIEERNQTARYVRMLNEERDMTLVIIEHDMDFVRDIAQKVTVLHQGQVFTEGTMDEIEANEDVRDIYLGQNNDA